MGNSLNYLKFDLRIIRKSSKQFLIGLVPFIIFMFSGNSFFGMSYLLLCLIILSSIPFSIQGNEKSTEMYNMFPAKISNMVFGRFLYLVCLMFLIFVIGGISIMYLVIVNKLNTVEVLAICLTSVLGLIVCFIQYPLYYKVGLQNNKITFFIIYFVPSFMIYMLPNFLKENNLLQNQSYINNNVLLILLSTVTIVFIGYISYCISCKICRRKDI